MSLKLTSVEPKAKPLLIWGVGTDRESLRVGCEKLQRLCKPFPAFAPVLLTDVADFAFFSRLGWLVEYVPRLQGEGEPYENRKLRYLARLYRGAPVLPVSPDLDENLRPDEMRRWLEPSD